MSERPMRPRGTRLAVLDLDGIGKEHLPRFQAAEPDRGWTRCKVEHGPYGVAQAPNGRVYVICNEGVGWEVHEGKPFPVDLWLETDTSSELSPRHRVWLTPDEVLSRVTGKTVDLADLIRTFGDRLENNFDLWHRRLNDKE